MGISPKAHTMEQNLVWTIKIGSANEFLDRFGVIERIKDEAEKVGVKRIVWMLREEGRVIAELYLKRDRRS